MDNKLVIELSLESNLDKSSSSDVKKKSEKLGKQSGEKFEDGFKKGTTNLSDVVSEKLKGIKTGAVFAAVGVALAAGLKVSIDAAIVQEESINRLNAALKVSNSFSQEASQGLQEYASELQGLTRFGDENILNQIALAKSFGATNDQAKRIASVAVDLAEAFDIDLVSATRNAAKTLGGYASELGEVLPELKKLTTAQLQAGAGIDVISKKFGGTAKERVNSFAGASQQASNAFGDVLEGFGQFITDNPLVISGLQKTTSYLGDFATGLKVIAKEFNSAFGKKEDLSAIQEIDKQLIVAIEREEKLRNALNGASAGTSQGQAFEQEIKQLESLQKGLQRRRKALVDSRVIEEQDKKASDEKQLMTEQQLQQALANIGLTKTQVIKQQRDQQLEIIRQAEEQGIQDKIGFDERRLEVERQYTEQLNAINLLRRDQAIEASGDIASATINAFKDMKVSTVDLGKSLRDLAINGYGKAFQNIGSALAKGESASNAFTETVKATAGEAASAFGDYYIKLGIAKVASGVDVSSGYATIAGGSALKVLSGVLGSSSGGSSGSASSGASSGSSFSDNSSPLNDQQEVVQSEQKDSIQLVVQGSIFNTSETARDLTKLLNENFENTGAVLSNARFA